MTKHCARIQRCASSGPHHGACSRSLGLHPNNIALLVLGGGLVLAIARTCVLTLCVRGRVPYLPAVLVLSCPQRLELTSIGAPAWHAAGCRKLCCEWLHTQVPCVLLLWWLSRACRTYVCPSLSLSLCLGWNILVGTVHPKVCGWLLSENLRFAAASWRLMVEWPSEEHTEALELVLA